MWCDELESMTHNIQQAVDESTVEQPIQAVPRLDAQDTTADQTTAELFFQHYQKPGKPVVLTGFLADCSAWNLNFLEQQLGDLVFPVRRYGQERYQQDKRQWKTAGSGVEAVQISFRRYLEQLRNGEAAAQDLYLARCALKDTPLAEPELLTQPEQQLNLRWPATPLNLWLGSGGHTSCLHYDPMDGTLTQLMGVKRVILFPPHQLYNLYPLSILNHLRYGLKLRSVYSQVYPDAPDLKAFPRFARAQQYRYETELQPGEILFIPSGWWHEVQSIGTGAVCSTNRFWHVYPPARGVRLWSKWRAHLGGVFALPHTMRQWLVAIASPDRRQKLRQLFQQL